LDLEFMEAMLACWWSQLFKFNFLVQLSNVAQKLKIYLFSILFFIIIYVGQTQSRKHL